MKKTISIIHYASPPVVGGVEFVIEAQARYLISRGFEVKIIAGKGQNFLPGIKFVRIPEIYSLHREVVKAQEALKKGNTAPFKTLKVHLEKKLREETKNSKTIIYHNCLNMPFNIALTASCHSLMGNEKRHLVWLHDSPLFDPFYKPLLNSIETAEYPWNLLTSYSPRALYITITEERKKQAINILGIPEERIRVIPNGIEVSRFLSLSPALVYLLKKINAVAPDYVALLPARLIRRKNIEMGIRIIKEMNQLHKKVLLLITAPSDPHRAEDEYRREIKDLIKKLNIEEKIIFLNEFTLAPEHLRTQEEEANPLLEECPDSPEKELFPLNFENLKGLYAISDFLLLPSTIEGFGIPVLEAGISRLPVFCSNLPTLKEVGQDNLYYFSLHDAPETIAERILKTLAENPFSRLFQRVKKDFDWEKILDNYLLPLLQKC